MILPALLLPALLLSFLVGGRIERLAQVEFKRGYLVLIALGTQMLIFSSWGEGWAEILAWRSALYLLSLLLLIVAFWLNRRVPGMALLGVGLLLNSAVILANEGRMPVALEALKAAGMADSRAEFESMPSANSTLMGENTPLWFLGDIFAVPKQIPLANVFSVGDVLVGLGGAWFIFANMRGRRS